MNNGFENGDIDSIISDVSGQFNSTGIRSRIVTRETELRTECVSSTQGSSRCVAAVVFHSSPTETRGEKTWNYTLRGDGVLGRSIDVTSPDNDAQIYSLPLQRAIDFAIGRHESSKDSTRTGDDTPDTIFEYPFTSQTNEERDEANHARFMNNIISVLATGFYIAMVGVVYHLTGTMAAERESGMSQLLDVMMPNQATWQPQAVRLLSHQVSFSLIYVPGWVVTGIILGTIGLDKSSVIIPIISNVVCGSSLTSMAIFFASWFRDAQLSGITAVIISLVMAIVAQVTHSAPSWVVGVLSLLFPASNYVYLLVAIASWERDNRAASVLASPPGSGSTLPLITFWAFALAHSIVLPFIAALVERKLFGFKSGSRHTLQPGGPTAVSLEGFTKTYQPRWTQRLRAKLTKSASSAVYAVSDLNLKVFRGEVIVLLGANGSGKSTTLDAIAGMHSATAGSISLSYADYHGKFGHCPQKNVLWDDLTVLEHAKIFQRLKSTTATPSPEETKDLVQACDLTSKASTRSKALSGGQKRKLQLVMMFAGGSTICCVDEVSSGVDPLSRRVLWDILLAERGRRTILLTTHFLDEADVLADRIAIMAHGCLKTLGTSAEMKQRMTSGYRVHVAHSPGIPSLVGLYRDVPHAPGDDETVYLPGSSSKTAAFLKRIEADGITDYQVHGPTLEEAFLGVVEAAGRSRTMAAMTRSSNDSFTPLHQSSQHQPPAGPPHLLEGHPTSTLRQISILFMKRVTVLKRTWTIYVLAVVLPIIATGCATIFLSKLSAATCNPDIAELSSSAGQTYSGSSIKMVTGPEDQLSDAALDVISEAPPGAITYVDTLDDFYADVQHRSSDLMPGGFFLGEEPTFAWRADGPLIFAHTLQNVLNNLVLNLTIVSDFQPLDIPFISDLGNSMIFTSLIGFAMAVYPAFLTLYPNIERTRGIRSMQYSNGVSALSTWLAHLGFDFLITLTIGSVVVLILFAASNIWYNLGYLFLVFLLYGISSTLLCYVISLVAQSQLGAFAVAASVQAGAYLVYFITYIVILTYVDPSTQANTLTTAFYILGLLAPVCNLTRSLYLALNLFGVTCRDRELASYPGSFDVFGGPICYLIAQSFLLFGFLWVQESGISIWRGLQRHQNRLHNHPQNDIEMETVLASRGTGDSGRSIGLEVVGLTKKFKHHLAVDEVSFSIPKNECFALLGPNGAGKTTCISMIRGETSPSTPGGDVLVDGISALHGNRANARAKMGVCPQIDALDRMTVLEHLQFYARVRGVAKPQYNIDTLLDSLGLRQYSSRMAESLSGGNKRKLSLGIALMGNPTVLLLDEPSSGMDAASMRLMWRILSSVTPGRSLLLTTHSMEEADALATRAGVVAGRMLVSGKTEELRRKYGDRYFVHLVHKDGAHTSDAAMTMITRWVQACFPRAQLPENGSSYGQVRFELPRLAPDGSEAQLASVFETIERGKERVGVQYYSVSRATLEQVFLGVLDIYRSNQEG